MDEGKLLAEIMPKLNKGKCILILGPEAHLLEQYPEDNLPSHWDVMVEKVDALKGKSFNSAEGFFFRTGSTDDWWDEKYAIHEGVSQYYSALQPPAFYDYLASMPFTTIISLSPDDLMPRVMDRLGYQYDFVYYKKTNGGASNKLHTQYEVKNGKRQFKNSSQLTQLPDVDRPLIFNFLGYHDDSESILFTYESLFEFMYDVFPVNNIPDDIRNAISAADSFLFVGFGYRYWYLKILFFLFDKILKNQSKELRSQAIFNFGEKQNPIVQVYQQVFKMKFFKTPIAAFANHLFQQCAAENNLRIKDATQKRVKILFIASLPNGKMPIRPDKDWALIKKMVEVPLALGQIEIEEQLCTKAEEVLFHLNKCMPTILIVSVHGSAEGLFFETTTQAVVELTGEMLLDKLQAHRLSPGNQLQLVLLGACHSAAIAEKLTQIIDFSIGMIGPIHDESVRLFTGGFLRNYCLANDAVSSVEAGKQSIADDPQYNIDKDLVSYSQKQRRPSATGSPLVDGGRSTGVMQGK